jgi:uncharacterized iron-regulated protein
MKKRVMRWIVGIGVSLAMTMEAHAQTPDFVVLEKGQTPSSFAAMVDALATSDVVFLGENHDHKGGHDLQKAIVQTLLGRNLPVALGMEMFERDVQGVLDEYLAGYITEANFLQASRPWPNYKDHYRPMVELLKERNLPVIGTNAPRRYVSMVSRKGQAALQTLPTTSRAHLAPLPYSMTLPAGYEKELDEIFGGSHTADAKAAPNPNMPSPTNMKAAQALWDATMADSLIQFLRRDKNKHLVVHLNGSMHSDRSYGIVDRLRQAMPSLKIRTVSVRPDAKFPMPNASDYNNLADFVIVTPPDPKAQAVGSSK